MDYAELIARLRSSYISTGANYVQEAADAIESLQDKCNRQRAELSAAHLAVVNLFTECGNGTTLEINTGMQAARETLREHTALTAERDRLSEELAQAKQRAGSRMIVSRRLDWVRENLIDGEQWPDEAIDAEIERQAEEEWHD